MIRLFLLTASIGLLAAAPTRVLLIGNSYTYYHSMPRLLEELAQAAGQPDVEVRAFTRGGSTLLELELHPELRALLAEKWDYVVLQEHSTLGLSAWNGELSVNDPLYFLQGARLLAQRAKGAKLILYSTWGRKRHPEFQPYLDYAYATAAKELSATVAPVGRAWAAVREQHPGIDLFDPDGSHPSAHGSYLAACVLLRTIFAKPCTGLPATLRGTPINTRGQRENGPEVDLVNLKADVAAHLQRAADDAEPDAGVYPPWPTTTLSGRRPRADEVAGRWRGRVFFYSSPAAFDLELKVDGDHCSGVWRLSADNNSWSSSRRLATCRLTDQGFTFTVTDPASASVEQHLVAFNGKELTAVASLDFRTALRRLGGTWTARQEAAPRSSR